jgi:hypothetical protein
MGASTNLSTAMHCVFCAGMDTPMVVFSRPDARRLLRCVVFNAFHSNRLCGFRCFLMPPGSQIPCRFCEERRVFD